MGHPLTPNLSEVPMDDLVNKYNDLYKRMGMASRWGNGAMLGQLRLILEDYQAEIDRRNAKQLEEMQNKSGQFKDIIDIK
jgi:hypothetical protein